MRRFLLAIIAVSLPVCAHAEFLGVKKASETISFFVFPPIDSSGIQQLPPDSIQIFTYADNDTYAAYTASGAAYAMTGIDTLSERGGTGIVFADQIQDIDGDGGNVLLSIEVVTWTDNLPRETHVSVQIVSDSANTLWARGDTIQWTPPTAAQIKALFGDTLTLLWGRIDTLLDYDSLGAVKLRILKALPNAQPCDVETGGLLVTGAGSGTSYIAFSAAGVPYVDAYYVGGSAFSAVVQNLLNTRSKIGDTNTTAGITLGVLQAYRDTLTTIYNWVNEIVDSVQNQSWASTCGVGYKTVLIYVVDSTAHDTLSGAGVVIKNSGETVTYASGLSAGSPPSFAALLDSTTTYSGWAISPGYFFPLYSFTTTDGTDPDTVVIQGYDISSSATPASQMTTLTGNCGLQSDTLSRCRIEITLAGATAFYTSTGVSPYGKLVVYADGNGDWSATIMGTDSLNAYLPAGSNVATYCVEYKCPELQGSGGFKACNLSIPANGSTTALRDILAQ